MICILPVSNGDFAGAILKNCLLSLFDNQRNHIRMGQSVPSLLKCARSILLIATLGASFPVVPIWGQQVDSRQKHTGSQDPGRAVSGSGLLRQLSGALEDVVARVSPAVVQIQAIGFGPVENKNGVALIVRQHAIGSGVIVDRDGFIITNAHVIEGAHLIRVVLPTPSADSPLDIPALAKQQILDAKVIGASKETDLALLKVEGHNFPTLPLGRTSPVRSGELVVAIGSPEGLESSITMGVVSSVWRQPNPDLPMVYIQTDAPINPGNSGGPLVDLDGRVVGINTFILSKGGGSEGLGFATPAGVVNFVYQDLRKYGSVHRTELQVRAQTITPILAAGLGLVQSWGVVISDVTAEGLGDSAGLKVKDIIVSVDGHPILSLPNLMASLYMHPPEEALRLQILRDSVAISLTVPVKERRDMMEQLADLIDPSNRIELLGIFVVDVNGRMRAAIPDMSLPDGVIVVGQSPEPAAFRADVRTGDIIRALNLTPIKSVEQLKSVVRAIKPGDPLVLQIERQGVLQYVSLEAEEPR
jgi:serine protease Do